MQKYLQTFNNYSTLMSNQVPFSKLQNLLVLAHSINLSNKLVCISNDQQCEFPENWRIPHEDTYTFTYRNNRNSSLLNVRGTQRGARLELILSQVGSTQSYRILLELNHTNEQNAKTYDFNLQQYLKQSEKRPSVIPARKTNNTNIRNNSYNQPHNSYTNQIFIGQQPKQFMKQTQQLNNPFGQEEYVGPNSQIFTNPYQYQNPYPGSLRIPPGARYDKIDPFDNPLQDNRIGPQQFFGFDQHGRPKMSPFSNNSNSSNRFGGGNFGGFGNNFGI